MSGQDTGDYGRLSIVMTEPHRAVRFESTLDGDGIRDCVEVFRYALLSFGFAEGTVDRYLPRNDE